jgi:Glycosyl hydrolases family 2, TIM barrel domain
MKKNFVLALFKLLFLTSFNIFADYSLPLKVKITKSDSGFQMCVNEKPFFIKGAAGFTHLKRLQECGANSFRTWSTQGVKPLLDSAYALGLTVTLGLEMALERQGFRYADNSKVNEQFEKLKTEIERYKNHPALLTWGIGNELELSHEGFEVWDAVEQLARYIHLSDPNHPVTTMLAGVPREHIIQIMKRCPSLDFISINAFRDLPYVHEKLVRSGWKLPYLITEWGSDGYWESAVTSWGAFIEKKSDKKAKQISERYKNSIVKNKKQCLGSYVFYWGYKQERTHTVFSFFNEIGEETEFVETMQQVWTGKKVNQHAPCIKLVTWDSTVELNNLIVKPGTNHSLSAQAMDPDKDELQFEWELYYETNERKEGGDREEKPPSLKELLSSRFSSSTKLNAPVKEGSYRLFLSVRDKKGKIAYANIPFYVKS